MGKIHLILARRWYHSSASVYGLEEIAQTIKTLANSRSSTVTLIIK